MTADAAQAAENPQMGRESTVDRGVSNAPWALDERAEVRTVLIVGAGPAGLAAATAAARWSKRPRESPGARAGGALISSYGALRRLSSSSFFVSPSRFA